MTDGSRCVPTAARGRGRDLTSFGLGRDTRILCADFIWHPVGDLRADDEIIAFDDYPQAGRRRRMTIATVLSCDRIRRPSYRLTLTGGREVIAAEEHSWLSGLSDAAWIHSRFLTEGREIRDFGLPWQRDNSWENGWIGGVFDGEASFSTRGTVHTDGWYISFPQNPGAVFDLACFLTDKLGYATTYKPEPHRRICRLHVVGMYDCLRLLGQCRPVRLVGKGSSWLEGRACGRTRGNRGRPYSVAVERIEFLGVRQVVAIRTSTNTLFAEGLFSGPGVKHKLRDRPGGALWPPAPPS